MSVSRSSTRIALALALVATAASASLRPHPSAQEQGGPLDKRYAKELSKLAEDWFEVRPVSRFEDWDAEVRAELEQRVAEFEPLPAGHLAEATQILFEAAQDEWPVPSPKGGKLTFETPWGEAWSFVGNTKKDEGFVVGLHGGGPGVGDAGAARSNWPIKELAAAWPQAVRLDTDAWSTVHGERMVLSLIDWAKIALGVDPDRVYSVGFSMGGTGTWHLAGRYPDLLAGAIPAHGVIMAAPKAQLPAPEDVTAMQHGVLPNVRNLAMYWYTGSVDRNCMPGTYLYAWKRLQELAAADEGGYVKQHFTLHEGLDHSFPGGEPGAGLEWIFEQRRDTFPGTIVWEYATEPFPLQTDQDPLGRLEQHGLYWLGCDRPGDVMRVRATRDGAHFVLDARGGRDFSILLHPDMVPYGAEVTVVDAAGKVLYRGTPEPDLAVLFETFDARLDRRLVFDRRIDL
ncbi:dienelactone hydrolase family protein [Engelhardtia mirabilis]|uniref:Dienelactone hydrolase domain-containing protein n=1 Tax=Engelhardtia mirabilis TaxID=2528011 RepID=A0A518BNM1_9BACT|nr:hypothetical protein Pla133_36560 [Planctomycetes bacterium Pla133]QDV02882.1 hypothetical protein Pla86_36540 [Planctomycetes bacterium Pla86]